MIAHVVLFKPKAELAPEARATLVSALEHALHNIPVIARATVGRRILLGTRYEQEAGDFPFAAILEFEHKGDLLAYLDHPAHRALGEQFYTAAETALAYDFELLDDLSAERLLS